jgi:hypothetical protein
VPPLNGDAVIDPAKCDAVAFMEVQIARQRRRQSNGQTVPISGNLGFQHRVSESIHDARVVNKPSLTAPPRECARFEHIAAFCDSDSDAVPVSQRSVKAAVPAQYAF